MAGEITLDGACSRVVTATTGTKSPVPHSTTLFPSDNLGWEFLLAATKRNNQARCSVFPTLSRLFGVQVCRCAGEQCAGELREHIAVSAVVCGDLCGGQCAVDAGIVVRGQEEVYSQE